MRNVIKSMKALFPPLRRASLRVSLQSATDSLRTVFSDSFVRFTRVFFLSFLRLTHRPPPSIQRVSFPPLPPSHSQEVVIRTTSRPQCLWALPSSAHHTAEFPELKLALTRGSTRAPVPLSSRAFRGWKQCRLVVIFWAKKKTCA